MLLLNLSFQAVIVLFDCQSIEPFKASDFWRNILAKIKDNFSGFKTEIDPLLEKEKNTNHDLKNIGSPDTLWKNVY